MERQAGMKIGIRNSIDRYKNLWARMEDYHSVVSNKGEGKAFTARHHLFSRSEILEKNWVSEYTDEMYDSIFDCLACYRWYKIPERLQNASGLQDETDIEILLDSAGYSTSLIAEELFSMIDTCLESGSCSENDLHRIRLAYNGLSGFKDIFVCRIVKWGPVENRCKSHTSEIIAGARVHTTAFVRNPTGESIYSA